MKNLVILILIVVFSPLSAQIAIGKTTLSGGSSLMEFFGNTATNQFTDTETTNTKGIILPSVSNVLSATNSHNGSFIFDKQSGKVKFYENNVWKDMSDEGNSSNMIPSVGSESGSGVIIGANSSVTKGVLIFESANKALVLPHIKNPDQSVISPYPGMICYDTVSNSIAVFDGINWSYWK